VTWLLRLLFALTEVAPFLVFKGGMSLSKMFAESGGNNRTTRTGFLPLTVPKFKPFDHILIASYAS
jgi:hypothetical protein